jgi:PAS domain S-box-containing protein
MSAHGPDLRVMCQRGLIDVLTRIQVPAFAFGIATLRFIAVNQAFETLLGYSAAELEQITAESIRPEADLPAFRRTLVEDVPPGFQRARYVRSDGTLINVKVHYRHVACVTDDGAQVKARMVVVEFWQ